MGGMHIFYEEGRWRIRFWGNSLKTDSEQILCPGQSEIGMAANSELDSVALLDKLASGLVLNPARRRSDDGQNCYNRRFAEFSESAQDSVGGAHLGVQQQELPGLLHGKSKPAGIYWLDHSRRSGCEIP